MARRGAWTSVRIAQDARFYTYINSFSDKNTLGICHTAFSSSPIMRTKSCAWDSPTARSLTKGYAMAKFAIQGAGDAKVTFSNKKVKNTSFF